jgi:hypothetical protein
MAHHVGRAHTRDDASTPAGRAISWQVPGMRTEQVEVASARLLSALRIYTAGLAMKRTQIERDHPHASASEVHRMLSAWAQKPHKKRRTRRRA